MIMDTEVKDLSKDWKDIGLLKQHDCETEFCESNCLDRMDSFSFYDKIQLSFEIPNAIVDLIVYWAPNTTLPNNVDDKFDKESILTDYHVSESNHLYVKEKDKWYRFTLTIDEMRDQCFSELEEYVPYILSVFSFDSIFLPEILTNFKIGAYEFGLTYHKNCPKRLIIETPVNISVESLMNYKNHLQTISQNTLTNLLSEIVISTYNTTIEIHYPFGTKQITTYTRLGGFMRIEVYYAILYSIKTLYEEELKTCTFKYDFAGRLFSKLDKERGSLDEKEQDIFSKCFGLEKGSKQRPKTNGKHNIHTFYCYDLCIKRILYNNQENKILVTLESIDQ